MAGKEGEEENMNNGAIIIIINIFTSLPGRRICISKLDYYF